MNKFEAGLMSEGGGLHYLSHDTSDVPASPPVDKQMSVKNYLPATSFADGNNECQ